MARSPRQSSMRRTRSPSCSRRMRAAGLSRPAAGGAVSTALATVGALDRTAGYRLGHPRRGGAVRTSAFDHPQRYHAAGWQALRRPLRVVARPGRAARATVDGARAGRAKVARALRLLGLLALGDLLLDL